MSHREGLPDLFLDRSLGRVQVPRLLRDSGLRLTTLAEYYGIPADETVTDTEWLEMVGQRGWAVFAKDKRVRYNPAERDVIDRFRVRYFYLSVRNLTAREMAGRFITNLDRIVEACVDAGPLIYSVHKNRIERISR